MDEYQVIYRNLSPRILAKVIYAIQCSNFYVILNELPDGRTSHVTTKDGKIVGYIGDEGIELCTPEKIGLCTPENKSLSEEHLRFAKFCQKQLGRIPKGIPLKNLTISEN